MKPTVLAVSIPSSSEISRHVDTSYFHDSYELCVEPTVQSALEIYLDVVAQTPEWINRLMSLRNHVVRLVGLKNLGHLGAVRRTKRASEYCVCDRVGIFSILYLSDEEVILGDSDKHLHVQVSVCKVTDPHSAVVVSTVVHIHNALGRVYMFFVAPAHRLIVPASLLRYASANQVTRTAA
jgi:hypothetical protein